MSINEYDYIVYIGETDASEETNKFTFQVVQDDMRYHTVWKDGYPKIIEHIEGGNICFDEGYEDVADKICKTVEHWFDTNKNRAWWRKHYKVYQMSFNQPLKELYEISTYGEKTHDELEMQIDRFMKEKFRELVNNNLDDFVLVNVETNNAEHRFEYVADMNDKFEILSDKLTPFLDCLEAGFLFEFIESYEKTYGKLFEGNKYEIDLFKMREKRDK